MRSVLLVFVLAVGTVHSMIRPEGYHHHKHHHDKSPIECDEHHTKTEAPTTPTTTTIEQTTQTTTTIEPTTQTTTTVEPTTQTTTTIEETTHTTTTVEPTTTSQPSCPSGFTLFKRTANANNSETSEWCLYAAIQKDPVNFTTAAEICASHSNAVLSNVANAEEKEFVTSQLLTAVQSYGYSSGAIAVDGRRISECVSRNKTVLATYPCSDQTLAYRLIDNHTDPAYVWTQWAAEEPSANAWTYDIEECLQLAVVPSKPKRNNLLNDIYCNFVQAPNDPNNSLYWNFGALCGVAPQ